MQIRFDSVTKSFGSMKALRNVSLTFAPGQIIALIGPNGAGKTTLMQCLCGLLAPDDGKILFDEQSFGRDRLDLRKKLMFMPDFPPLLPGGNMLHHIAMTLRLYERPMAGIESQVVTALKELDLLELSEMPVSTLSRGQSYKSALATLYLTDPDLWILDEPFASGMDPNGISSFKRRARDAAARGKIVLYSTQLLDLAETFSDQVGVIGNGNVHAFGPISKLKEQAAHVDGDPQGSVLEKMFEKLREH